MGAVIINTVIIHELKELLVLAIIIALHAILAVLIHWEIKNEKHNEKTADKAAAHKKQESCKDKGSCSTPKAENKTPKAHH